jgi:hypothetical protein
LDSTPHRILSIPTELEVDFEVEDMEEPPLLVDFMASPIANGQESDIDFSEDAVMGPIGLEIRENRDGDNIGNRKETLPERDDEGARLGTTMAGSPHDGEKMEGHRERNLGSPHGERDAGARKGTFVPEEEGNDSSLISCNGAEMRRWMQQMVVRERKEQEKREERLLNKIRSLERKLQPQRRDNRDKIVPRETRRSPTRSVTKQEKEELEEDLLKEEEEALLKKKEELEEALLKEKEEALLKEPNIQENTFIRHKSGALQKTKGLMLYEKYFTFIWSSELHFVMVLAPEVSTPTMDDGIFKIYALRKDFTGYICYLDLIFMVNLTVSDL